MILDNFSARSILSNPTTMTHLSNTANGLGGAETIGGGGRNGNGSKGEVGEFHGCLIKFGLLNPFFFLL
jgi:hypothetical protein